MNNKHIYYINYGLFHNFNVIEMNTFRVNYISIYLYIKTCIYLLSLISKWNGPLLVNKVKMTHMQHLFLDIVEYFFFMTW